MSAAPDRTAPAAASESRHVVPADTPGAEKPVRVMASDTP